MWVSPTATGSAVDLGEWRDAALADLVCHLRERFHRPGCRELAALRAESIRLASQPGGRGSARDELVVALTDLERRWSSWVDRISETLFPLVGLFAAGWPEGFPVPALDVPVTCLCRDHEILLLVVADLRASVGSLAGAEETKSELSNEIRRGLARYEEALVRHHQLACGILLPRLVSAGLMGRRDGTGP